MSDETQTLNHDLTDQEVAAFRAFIATFRTPLRVGDAYPKGWRNEGEKSWEIHFANAMPRLLNARDGYRALFKRIEWEGRNGNDDENAYCPACDSASPRHKPDCELDAILRPR